jgi:steroid delta-isomerase-like uncharacterized protein
MTSTSAFNDNLALVRVALDAINRGAMGDLAATVTPDFTRNDLAEAFVLDSSGADPLTAFITTVRTAMPDFRMEITDSFGNEDRVAIQIRLTGTHVGDFMGMPPTGRHVAINGVSFYRFRDGLICENTQLLDMAGLFRALTAPMEPAAAV